MAVWSSLILILAVAAPASVQGEGDCSASNRCGNMTILDPFVIVPEDATEPSCGEMGFQVNCQNNTPYLGYYHQSYESHAHPLQILHIFYGNSSLLVADTGKLSDLTNLSHRDCQSYKFPSTNSSSKIALPFTISPVNKNLILYSCGGEPPPVTTAEGLVEKKTCGNSTFVARVGGSYGDPDNSGRRYFLEGCDHVIVLPMLGESSGEANASSFVELISNGFLLTWQPREGEFILGGS
ncbi:hypothetical protein HU200_031336 [Digitaria exilis]|uniref:Wall-associated receptor kinase galacturonan-binding domain-containing protein n=1 Tax=Digitaria exilis TaxID=1010633 RepID=A0A835EQ84_9POAL|nr:hypothetical protein HU200_031336 [Digitaria exilis]CAB3476382.1 unnamed protein product [Digitaria exilis]